MNDILHGRVDRTLPMCDQDVMRLAKWIDSQVEQGKPVRIPTYTAERLSATLFWYLSKETVPEPSP